MSSTPISSVRLPGQRHRCWGYSALLVVGLFAWASCKQSAGERCEIDSDCSSGLTCQNLVCESAYGPSGSGGATPTGGSNGGTSGAGGESGSSGPGGEGGAGGAGGESGGGGPGEGGVGGTAGAAGSNSLGGAAGS
jgi:hypothetical protein